VSPPPGSPPAPEPRYLRDLEAGYQTSFEAEIVSLPPGAAVLSETLFYATGGGQPCDQGTLVLPDGERVPVVDVSHQGGLTLHRLGRRSGPALRRGMQVRGEIDWPRRYAHMRLHTAQHLLSALAYRRFGLRTDRAQLSGRQGYLDLERPLADAAAEEALFREANEAYFSLPVPLSLRFVTREEFAALPNRSGSGKLPPGVEEVRLVVIGEADLAPCGGTHLRNTSEVRGVRGLPSKPLPTGGQRISFELAEAKGTGAPAPTPSA
jgi:Ser-tRNA(Ala) deacylase AlaX